MVSRRAAMSLKYVGVLAGIAKYERGGFFAVDLFFAFHSVSFTESWLHEISSRRERALQAAAG